MLYAINTMPFVKVNWSRFENRKQRSNVDVMLLLRKITLPVRYLLVCIGYYFDYPCPKSTFWKSLAIFHILIALLVSILVSSVFLALVRFLSSDFLSSFTRARTTLLMLFYCQTVVALVFSMIWQLSKKSHQFGRILKMATTGIGLNRRFVFINRMYQLVLMINGIVSIFWICTHFLVYCTENLSTQLLVVNPLYFYILDPLFFVGSTLLFINWTATQMTILLYLAIISAEFTTINDDLDDDRNSYQEAVIKHYISIHSKLWRLLDYLNSNISWFIQMELVISAVSLTIFGVILAHNTSDWINSLTKYEGIVFFALGVTFVVQLFPLIAAFVIIRRQALYICRSMRKLVAENGNVQEQIYTITMAYMQHIVHKPPGVSLSCIGVIGASAFIFLIVTKLLML